MKFKSRRNRATYEFMESPVIYGFHGATGDSTSVIDGSIVAKNVRIEKHYLRKGKKRLKLKKKYGRVEKKKRYVNRSEAKIGGTCVDDV